MGPGSRFAWPGRRIMFVLIQDSKIMLDKNQIAAASKTLHDHWRAGTKFGGLDSAHRPHNRAEGYAIQGAIEN